MGPYLSSYTQDDPSSELHVEDLDALLEKMQKEKSNMRIKAQGFSSSRSFKESVEIEYLFCLCTMEKNYEPTDPNDPNKPKKLVELTFTDKLLRSHHCIRMIYMVIVEGKPQFRSFWIDICTPRNIEPLQTELHILRDPNNTKILKYTTDCYYYVKTTLSQILGISSNLIPSLYFITYFHSFRDLTFSFFNFF
jgi:hypothetical protein